VGLLLMPVSDVTVDDIHEELSTRHWYSTSTKLDLKESDLSHTMKALSSFLRAEVSCSFSIMILFFFCSLNSIIFAASQRSLVIKSPQEF